MWSLHRLWSFFGLAVAVVTAGVLLARCALGTPVAVEPAPVPSEPDAVDWIERIESGRPFLIVLDRTAEYSRRCPSCSWPLGTIRPGSYRARFDVEHSAFEVTGLHATRGREGTFTYVGQSVRDNEIVLWGHAFVFRTRSGLLYDDDMGLIGHLEEADDQRAVSAGRWRDRIASGRSFRAVLDGGAIQDEGFRTDRVDPLGTLLAGSTYEVRYVASTQSFVTTGFNESTGQVGTWAYDNAHLERNQISLWGALFELDPVSGELRDATWGLVGHLAE